MDEQKQVPNEVKALAQQVGLTPIDWAIKPNEIVIVFEQGQKLTFEREKVTPMIEKMNMIDKTFHQIENMRKPRAEADLEPLDIPADGVTPFVQEIIESNKAEAPKKSRRSKK